MATKTYGSRDSAVAVLRKMGVPKDKYNDFVTKTAEGKYEVDLDAGGLASPTETALSTETRAAKVAKAAKQKKPTAKLAKGTRKKAPKPEKKAKKLEKKEVKGREGSLASRIRELILKGKSNAEVYAALESELGESKKWFPGWYRADMRRKGQLPEGM